MSLPAEVVRGQATYQEHVNGDVVRAGVPTGSRTTARWPISTPHELNLSLSLSLSLLQHYSGSDGTLIRAIHKMDIEDKHRLLLRFLVVMEEFTPFPVRALEVDLTMRTEVFREGIEVGTEIMRMRFDPSDPNFQAEMHSDLTPRVPVPEFGFFSVWGHPVTLLAAGTVAVGRAIEAFQA